MLRSQDMSLIALYLNRDIAKQGVQYIGQNPSVHFINLNTHLKADQLPFNKEVRYLEKLLARIKFFENESKEMENKSETKIKTQDLENDVNKHYNRLTYLREIRRDTLEKLKTLREDMFVVEELESYIVNNSPEENENYKMNLDHVCFVIPKEKKTMLESVLYYNLRRNACVYNNDKTIEISEIDKFYNVSGFVIFTHGLNAIEKVDNLIISLGGRIISEKSIEIGSIGLNDKINQVSSIFENNEGAVESELISIAEKIEYWKYCVNKEMQIYITMNGLGFKKDSDNLVGHGFVLREDLSKIKGMCDYISKKYGYSHFDILKHYTVKDEMICNDIIDSQMNKSLSEEQEPQEYSYELDESDSNIQTIIKIHDDIETRGCNGNFNKSEDGSISFYEDGIKFEHKIDNEEKLSKNKNNDHTDADLEKENLSTEKLHLKIKNAENNSKNIDDSQSSQNQDNGFLYKVKSSSTPSIIAVDEDKMQKLELPEYKVENPITPPTHFHTNKFTKAFQDLNDVYGIPSYKEINPAVFYIVTFPFMFGVMFGDVGHGIMLLFISLYLIRYEKTLKVPDFFEQIFVGRYIMLVCSIWSIFFGFLYSDFLSLSIPIFSSEFTNLNGKYDKDENYTYPFGLDHTWHGKANAPQFSNSLKMKMSVILGFSHMFFGAILGIMNARYMRDKISLFCIVIPQTIAFVSFVGYLIFLIFFKWVSTENRQGLISVIVSMFTSPFTVELPMYPYQKEVQLFLCSNIIVSLIWMLFTKPVYETLRHRRMKKKRQKTKNAEDEDDDEVIEIWMHGLIETIEFGIGLVSNTSSYLRLWAISLAHSELTNVLHTMTIGNGSIIVRIILSPLYVFFTVTLLLGLEGLSSCLHALRLNWIEFNGKFYKGAGYHFRPLDFKAKYDD